MKKILLAALLFFSLGLNASKNASMGDKVKNVGGGLSDVQGKLVELKEMVSTGGGFTDVDAISDWKNKAQAITKLIYDIEALIKDGTLRNEDLDKKLQKLKDLTLIRRDFPTFLEELKKEYPKFGTQIDSVKEDLTKTTSDIKERSPMVSLQDIFDGLSKKTGETLNPDKFFAAFDRTQEKQKAIKDNFDAAQESRHGSGF